MRFEPPPLGKKFSKKTWKSFGGSKKCLTFASAFRKKALKKSSLKDLDISKQVVQVLSGKDKKQKPSILETSKENRFGS